MGVDRITVFPAVIKNTSTTFPAIYKKKPPQFFLLAIYCRRNTSLLSTSVSKLGSELVQFQLKNN